MTPSPETSLNVLKNEPIHLFVFLNEKFAENKATTIKMKYYDSIEAKQ